MIQFGAYRVQFRTHWSQSVLWVRTVSAVRTLGPCMYCSHDAAWPLHPRRVAAWLVDFNSCKEKSSEQKTPAKPVSVSDDHVLALSPLERQKLWQWKFICHCQNPLHPGLLFAQAKPKALFSFDLNHFVVVVVPRYSYPSMPFCPDWLKELNLKDGFMVCQAVGEGVPQAGFRLVEICKLCVIFTDISPPWYLCDLPACGP